MPDVCYILDYSPSRWPERQAEATTTLLLVLLLFLYGGNVDRACPAQPRQPTTDRSSLRRPTFRYSIGAAKQRTPPGVLHSRRGARFPTCTVHQGHAVRQSILGDPGANAVLSGRLDPWCLCEENFLQRQQSFHLRQNIKIGE